MRQYYEIRRAKTLAEICGARYDGDASVQKELSAIRRQSLDKDAPQIRASAISTADANHPTGGDRSKVHPADKYIEGLASPVVDVNRAPSAMCAALDVGRCKNIDGDTTVEIS